MRLGFWVAVVVVVVAVAGGSVAVSSNPSGPPFSVSYSNFDDLAALELTNAMPASGRVRLTENTALSVGSMRLKAEMYVRGFDSTWTFEMSDVSGGQGHDGMAFVVLHNNTKTFAGTEGGLGYASPTATGVAGLRNSYAIEMDTWQDTGLHDPNGNHISVHSLGTEPNSADEDGPAALCDPITNVLAMAKDPSAPFTVRVRYEPPFGWDATPGAKARLTVWTSGIVEGTVRDVATISSLVPMGADGLASLMFTASTGASAGDTQELLSWDYTFLGHVNANTSRASGAGTTGATAGDLAEFTVQAYDQFGYPYPVSGDTIAISAPGQPSGGAAESVTSLGGGAYRVTYRYTHAATAVPVAVTLNGVAIHGSPLAVDVAPAAASAWNCTASVSSLATVAGEDGRFVLTAHDRFGNQLRSGGLTITTQVSPATKLPFESHYTSAGQYNCSFVITEAGTHEISVFVGGAPANQGQTLHVTTVAGPFSASRSAITGTGAFSATAGIGASLVVSLFDAYGNPVHKGEATVTAVFASGSGSPLPAASVVNQGNGNYTVTYTADVAGDYSLEIWVASGAPGNGTKPTRTLSISVVSDGVPDASKCSVGGSGVNRSHVAGSTAVLALTPRDAFGNLVGPGHVDMTVTIRAGPDTFPSGSPVYNPKSQTMDVTYELTKAQAYTITVAVNNAQVPGSPFATTVRAGALDGAACRVEALSSGALSSTVTGRHESFRVKLTDAYGNHVTGTHDNVTIAAHLYGPKHYELHMAADADDPGYYVGGYSASKTGTYTLTVLVNGENAHGSPFSISVAWAYTYIVVISVLVGVGTCAIAITTIMFVRIRMRRRTYVHL